jgi:hypothetical protein
VSRRLGKIEDIIHSCYVFVEGLNRRYIIGSEQFPVEETDTQVSLAFSDEDLAWVRSPFRKLALSLMSVKLKEAQFTTELFLNVHDLTITLDISLVGRQLVCSISGYGGGGAVAGLPPKAVKTYENLQGFLRGVFNSGMTNVSLAKVIRRLSRLEDKGIDERGEQQISITAEARFFLNKKPLVDKLMRLAPRRRDIFVSVYLFPDKLKDALTEATLSDLEERFYVKGKKTVIVVFGARGALQGDFISVCGDCPVDEIRTAFEAPGKKKGEGFKAIFEFRSRACNWQFTSHLMPESLRTVAFTRDKVLLAIQDQLKKFEALLAVFSLANRVFEEDPGQYKAYFEGQKTVDFLVQKKDIKKKYVKDAIALYDWAYENASYDKIGVMRNVIVLYAEKSETLMMRAEKIGESAISSYQFYLKNKIESYFETKRKIRELIDGFARETADEVAKLTKEINENIYKTAGVIAGAVIAILIRPENTLLILSIGGAVIVLFLLSILIFHLRTMRTQFENRQGQHDKDLELFAEALEEDEVQEFRDDETVNVKKSLFEKELRKAKIVYISFIGFVVVALAVFFIVQSVT